MPHPIQAIRVHAVGGPEVLTLGEIEPGPPAHGQARVAIEKIGVNFIDTYHRTGAYPMPLPFTPGVEAAGRVEAIGETESSGGADLAVGDRVAWTMMPGTYAEAQNVPTSLLVPIPPALSTELAAATLLQGMTAHYLTHGCRSTQSGDTALVHAAAGGTGGLLVQTLKRAGARVLATCSTEEKAELARASGADEVILYSREDFKARTLELTNGRGVDVVYDSVGQTTFEGSLASLRPRGLLCLFGQASGPVPPFDLARLGAGGSLFVTRPSLAHFIATREELEERAGDVFAALVDGSLRQRIGGRYALGDAAAAHRDLEGRGTTGKLLLETGKA
jgi:NADPH2:quinone reductase